MLRGGGWLHVAFAVYTRTPTPRMLSAILCLVSLLYAIPSDRRRLVDEPVHLSSSRRHVDKRNYKARS